MTSTAAMCLAMPRRARMHLPGLPHHVFQRGNNRNACFFDREDRECYLSLLLQTSQLYELDVHAFALMTNHIHLLLTPASADSISRMTRVVGSRYAQYVNKKYLRTMSTRSWELQLKNAAVSIATLLIKRSITRICKPLEVLHIIVVRLAVNSSANSYRLSSAYRLEGRVEGGRGSRSWQWLKNNPSVPFPALSRRRSCLYMIPSCKPRRAAVAIVWLVVNREGGAASDSTPE